MAQLVEQLTCNQRREGLRVRIVGDELPEEALPVKDSIDLEDVYMYHVMNS